MSSISFSSDEPSPSSPLAATSVPPPRKNHLDTYRANRQRLYPDVADAQWNDWKWQLKNRVSSLEALESKIRLTKEERAGVLLAGDGTGVCILCVLPIDLGFKFRVVGDDCSIAL